jgi:peptidylprolyl isomerase
MNEDLNLGPFSENEYAPNVTFNKPGILAMANAGPNTNGS